MAEIFTIGARGLERLETAPQLKRGTIIYGYGYAMNLQIFAVLDPQARTVVEIDREPVEDVDSLPDDYFSPLNTYDEYIKPHAQRFGIGFYYDTEEPRATEEQIAQGLERAENIKKYTAQREQEQREQFAKAQDEARAKYGAILTETTDNDYTQNEKTAADNMRKLLRVSFPGVRFSLRAARGSSFYYLNWTDGPTREQVENIIYIFDDTKRDKYNDDLREHITNGFTSIYGTVEYIAQREITTDAAEKIARDLQKYTNLDTLATFDRCEILNAAPELPEEWREILCSSYANRETLNQWAYIIAHHLDLRPVEEPTKEDPNQDAQPETAQGLCLIEYSAKAIAVIGDTYPHRATLKKLGGKFNARLSCGAGWIFSKEKESEVKSALNL